MSRSSDIALPVRDILKRYDSAVRRLAEIALGSAVNSKPEHASSFCAALQRSLCHFLVNGILDRICQCILTYPHGDRLNDCHVRELYTTAGQISTPVSRN